MVETVRIQGVAGVRSLRQREPMFRELVEEFSTEIRHHARYSGVHDSDDDSNSTEGHFYHSMGQGMAPVSIEQLSDNEIALYFGHFSAEDINHYSLTVHEM